MVAVGGAGAILTGLVLCCCCDDVGRILRDFGDFVVETIVAVAGGELVVTATTTFVLFVGVAEDDAFAARSNSAIASCMARSNCEFNFRLLFSI